MSTELQVTPQKSASALQVMASKFSVEPAKLLDTLKATVFKNATNEELLALVVVANVYGLNPLTKEIYAFPAKGGGIVPVVSVDGWVNLINSHPQMDGLEFETHNSGDGKLEAITCTIWRKDRSKPIKVTEYLSECRRNTEPWKMEHRMLRHKALIQGGRVAFGFSGVYDEDDAAAIDITDRVTVVETGRVGQAKVNPLTITKGEKKPEDKPAPQEKPAEPAPKAEAPKPQPAAQAEQPASDAEFYAEGDQPAQQEKPEPAKETPAAPETLDIVKLRNEVTRLAAVDKIAKAQIVIYLQKNQIVPEDQDSFTDIAPEVLQTVVKGWSVIAAEIKEAK